MNWNLTSSYSHLPEKFFTFQNPIPPSDPKMVLWNEALAQELGLEADPEDMLDIASILSGQKVLPGTQPIAQAYAGHQFGHFTILGDGRAVLLGEKEDVHGQLRDIQLKGSGQTPYSRRGDGRGTLKSMLREYLMSESMHALGIPTTRSLAVCLTGENIFRQGMEPSAVLTRIARSHIRVGTFEYARNFTTNGDFQRLFNYTVERHFPEVGQASNAALAFLEEVMNRQIDLITEWMRVGFIHGVMNTDNMSIPGDTMDYGPCAFMNAYDPRTVFSSIDTQGRYAFGNQPAIGRWNLAILAGTLLPLIHEDRTEAMAMGKAVLEKYAERFEEKMYSMMGRKLGFLFEGESDQVLIDDLLQIMFKDKMDFTWTFAQLTYGPDALPHINVSAEFLKWKVRWEKRLSSSDSNPSRDLMMSSNPFIIPRNHKVEEVLTLAQEEGDIAPFEDYLDFLRRPYDLRKLNDRYHFPPEDFDREYQTFCGT